MEPTLPIYHQIRRYIKHAVLDKVYPADHQIPPEQELATQFKVNRITIRQAISSLVEDGLLIRKRGKGTFVTSDEALIQKMSFKNIGMITELLLPLGQSKTLTVKMLKVKPETVVREKLELGDSEEFVIKIVRDRLVPEGFRAFTINYLPYEVGSEIEPDQLLKKPLLSVLEEDLSLNFSEAFQTIEASFADAQTAEHLGVQPGSQVLLIERIMYAENSKPVEMVQTIYDASLYKCSLSLRKNRQDSSSNWVCQITT